jgi:dipeptidase D
MHIPKIIAAFAAALPLLASAAPQPPGPVAVKAAKYAVSTYRNDIVDTLAKLVSYNTVADPKVPLESNPQHLGFKQYLKEEAARLGFDYVDDGYVVVIGYGSGTDRVGVITHGDVQPVDPTKWKKSPFELDRTSEPGRLLARGSEDDKGPIATALYAMKAIKDQGIPLKKRIELFVYMAEESNSAPLDVWLKSHTPPQINITLDSEYPAVTAEKGWGMVNVQIPAAPAAPAGTPAIAQFGGGFFASQIPEDARATVTDADAQLEAAIKARAAAQKGMQYTFTREGTALHIKAKGLSAHSSKPENGVNAVSMLADALKVRQWPATTGGNAVNLLNDLVGPGYVGAQWGKIAYRDSFMGPMTFAPTVITEQDGALTIGINVRRPQGKTEAQLHTEITEAFAQWQATHAPGASIKMLLTDPWVQKGAPQIDTLLGVFSYFTGMKNPKPIAIGGATNSRQFPNAVSFGPTMPGTVYSGHSEHEFITVKQLLLNLEMYTAVLAELAK